MFDYKILEEEVKSDFAFEVKADSLEELFKGAGLATMKAMINPEEIKLSREWSFNLTASDEEMLLYDFLAELIYLKDVDTALFGDFEIKIDKEQDISLNCNAKGSPINWDEDILYTDVKAVTAYEFKVEKRENEWFCHVVLDL